MANLVYRASATPVTPTGTTVKNTPLSNLEVDANFKSIDDELKNKADTSTALALAIALG